ncbi:MAG: DUF4347 domain-containing protein [Cyanobacteriota bacterium]
MQNIKEAQSNGLHQAFNFSKKLCHQTLENRYKTSSTIVFIDSAVDDYQSLVNGVIPEAEVIVLDSTHDGVVQITEVLQGRNDIAAIHIVSHGSPGCLYLGNTQLNFDTLERYASQLQVWATSLTSSPILLYGCNVAAGDAGTEFVQRLHQLTGADIAASANRTGSAALGGDWELEVVTGIIEAPLAFHAEVRKAYSAVLGTFIVDSNQDVVDANDGVTTLREAIEEANNQGGKDIIEFDPGLSGQTITLTNGQLEITDDLFINGLSADNLSVSGGNNSRVFLIDDGNNSNLIDVGIEGLTVTDGQTVGLNLNGGGILNRENLTISNSTISGNTAVTQGGGIFNDAILTVIDSTISGNTAELTSGGGIVNGGILTVTNSTINGNTAGRFGGGIFAGSPSGGSSQVTITNSTIDGNTAGEEGGGIFSSGGSSNTLEISDSIISGNTVLGDECDKIIENGGGISNSARMTLTNSIIRNNTVQGSGLNPGGGIFNTARMTLTNSTIDGNRAGRSSAIDNTGTLTLTDSIISHNIGRAGDTIGNSDELTVINSTISNNKSEGGGDSGISNIGPLMLIGSTISNNTGGTEAGGIDNSGTVTMLNSTISGNTATGGGGIRNGGSGTVTITNSTISGNTASSSGGIDNSDSGTVKILNSTISGNIGDNSGGIYNGQGTVTVTNSTISGNTATGNGGGISNYSGTLTVTHSTITGNVADSDGNGTGDGGGIYIYDGGTAEVNNSIIAGNFDNSPAPNPSHPDVSGSFTTNNFNLIGNPIGSTGFENDKTFASEGITDITQVLDPVLSDNGGPTQTHALVFGSPAIDMASVGVTTDQRGVSRPFGSNPDIGAVEFVPLSNVSNITVDTLVDENDGDLSPGDVSLREAILFSSAGGTIDFDPCLAGGTITLTQGELVINKDLTINGLGADNLTVSGNNASRVFNINDGDDSSLIDVVIEGLTIANGFTISPGGGIDNQENLTVINSTIRDNKSSFANVDGRGGGISNGFGSDIANLTVINSTISGNRADSAGGIFNDSTLTVINSTISGNRAEFGIGGGIEMRSGTLTVSGTTIRDNSAAREGGGINIGDSPNTLILSDSTISGNSAGNDGGGIYSIGSSNTLEVTNSTISGNLAGNSGGGIEISEGGNLTLTDSTISDNTAKLFGGGILNEQSTVTVTNSTISSNQTDEEDGSAGGGIYNNRGTVAVTDTTISDNYARLSGGGIFSLLGTLTVTSSTISGNRAEFGSGGGLNTFGGTLTVTNSTISGNTAGTDGGGIESSLSNLTVINSTITQNMAGASPFSSFANGGGISSSSGGTIKNTIIAGNSVKTELVEVSRDVYGFFNTTDSNSNLIGDGTGSNFTNGINGNIVGTSCNPIDPLLGRLQDNGGPTFTHALLDGSPAINAGNNANIPDGITTDQHGEPRIVDDTVDIGAFEAALFSPIVICCCEHNGDPWNTTNNHQLSAFSTGIDTQLISAADCWV